MTEEVFFFFAKSVRIKRYFRTDLFSLSANDIYQFWSYNYQTITLDIYNIDRVSGAVGVRADGRIFFCKRVALSFPSPLLVDANIIQLPRQCPIVYISFLIIECHSTGKSMSQFFSKRFIIFMWNIFLKYINI